MKYTLAIVPHGIVFQSSLSGNRKYEKGKAKVPMRLNSLCYSCKSKGLFKDKFMFPFIKFSNL